MELSFIESKIFTIRNQSVMLDRDLAELYGVTTGNLNKAVKRNSERFPNDFMFQLSKEEFDLIFQNGTSSWGGTRKMPYAFTELGVAMLSSVLNSKTAIQINMAIMRTFVAVRQVITVSPAENEKELRNEMKELKAYIDEIFTDQNDINEDTRMQLELINQSLAELQANKSTNNIQRRRIGLMPQNKKRLIIFANYHPHYHTSILSEQYFKALSKLSLQQLYHRPPLL